MTTKDGYTDLIRDKRVALVGPAKYMENTQWGREIDDHDVVVRINRGIESIETFGDSIGTRTDILYSCLIEKAQQTGVLVPQILANEYKIKWIVAPPHSDMKGRAGRTRFHDMVNIKKVREIEKLIPVDIVDHVFHTSLAGKVVCKPNTGFMAIYDLLRHNPTTLSVYGFSFYLDGFITGQKSGVEREKNCTEQEFADMAFNSKRHVQKNMWEYAKTTLLGSDVVRPDPVLRKILDLQDFSRKEFERKMSE